MRSRGRGDGLFEELLALRGGWASGCCPLVSNAVVAEENGEPRPREWAELAGYGGTATFAFGVLLEGGCNMRKGIQWSAQQLFTRWDEGKRAPGVKEQPSSSSAYPSI